MAPFKEEHYLIILPGSQFSLCSYGRTAADSLSLPTYKIPTKVYHENGAFKSISSDESNAIYPIQKGKIVNVEAFNYFLKLVLSSVLKHTDSYISPSQILLSLISSNGWTKTQCEYITNHVFEKLDIGGFNIIPSSMCSSFAHGSLPNSLVIDVGHEKVDISPIIDFQNLKHLNVTIPKGSTMINEKLGSLLPNLSASQIESLKKSDIFEVLNEEDAKNSFFGLNGLDLEALDQDKDEGVLDIALIVTSDRDTREILDEKKSDKTNAVKSDKPNSELEKNTFIDEAGNEIEVGKERFHGVSELIKLISFNVKISMDQISALDKKQECFDNLIVVGPTSKIKGFKEALLVQLLQDHLIVIRSSHESTQSAAELAFRNETGPASISATGANNINNQLLGSNNEIYNISQVPKSIKYLKFPDYFPVWKKLANLEDVTFLGAEILTKQIFGTGHGNNYGETLYLAKDSYLANGPVAIWDVAI